MLGHISISFPLFFKVTRACNCNGRSRLTTTHSYNSLVGRRPGLAHRYYSYSIAPDVDDLLVLYAYVHLSNSVVYLCNHCSAGDWTPPTHGWSDQLKLITAVRKSRYQNLAWVEVWPHPGWCWVNKLSYDRTDLKLYGNQSNLLPPGAYIYTVL